MIVGPQRLALIPGYFSKYLVATSTDIRNFGDYYLSRRLTKAWTLITGLRLTSNMFLMLLRVVLVTVRLQQLSSVGSVLFLCVAANCTTATVLGRYFNFLVMCFHEYSV
jgi:hypothetical protein